MTIVVADGGELVLNGTTNMSTSGRFVVLGGGKISGTAGSTLTVCNAGGCYNAGEIDYAGELNTNGSDFYNCGTINVDLLRNTSGGQITNFGSITSRTDAGSADTYNCTVINGCYMHYTENAGVGTLTLLDNARIDIDGQAEFAGTVTMSDKSMVNAGSLYLTNTVFAGPTGEGEFSVVKTGRVLVGQGDDLKQSGNSYFDWDVTKIFNKDGEDMSTQATDGVHGIKDVVKQNITKFVNEATSPYVIPEGECTGVGYNPNGDGGDIPATPQKFTCAFEDLGNSYDIDFNDVVIYVYYYAQTNTCDVKWVAAGGEKGLRILYDDETIFIKRNNTIENTQTDWSH